MSFRITLGAIAIGLCAASAQAQDTQDMATATAEMIDTEGNPVGTVVFTEGPNGVLVRAELSGLPSGWRGFHVHETGACTPAFEDAGGHYNPEGNSHGLLYGEGYHAGDLPNIWVHADGVAMAHYFTDAFTLAEGAEASLNDEDGSAVIVHENPDSYLEDAGAGGRIACGVIAFGN